MPVNTISVRNAIAIAEGYGASPTNEPTRNNNPGDITAGTGVYSTVEAGVAALDTITNSIATGGTAVAGDYYNDYAHSLNLSDSSQLTIQQVGYIYANGARDANYVNWVNNVSTSLGVSPDTKFSDAVNGRLPIKNPQTPNYQTSLPPGGIANNSSTGDVAGSASIPLNHSAENFSPLNLSAPTIDYTSLFPDAIINTGLDATPWYKDTNLVTGNPKVRGSVAPVIFEVMLHDRQDVFLPTSPEKATTADQYPPLQVQLNASMKTFNISSKHVVNPQRSRTGWHITMWGMQADLIEGNCSTGVFMNKTGITDLFSTSTSGVSADMIQALSEGFKYAQSVNPSYPQEGGEISTGAISGAVVPSNQDSFNQMLSNLGITSNQPFRVAAQDAFVEFLSLFKMNGIRWFYNKDFTAESGSSQNQAKEQVDIDAWSPELGISATQLNGRMGDVMSRGAVLMKFKGTTYYGYFKSLSWSQSADSPFKWDFNFVFQVERTFGFVFNPTG